MTPGDVAELVRAPAALTVLGDTLAGMASAPAGTAVPARRTLLPVASACLYLGGMALNDYGDRELDAVERPERPIPSGRVTPGQALAVGAGLTAAGVAMAGLAGGRRSLAVALPLAACVWTYDLAAKSSPVGPVVMAACRGLDVLLGAAPTGLRAALPAAGAMTAHTLGLTVLSRGEVHGTTRPVAAAVAAGTSAVSVLTAAAAVASSGAARTTGAARTAGTVAAVAAAAAYAASCLPAQARAAEDPSAGAARHATRAGIQAMVALQAAWTLRGGRLAATSVLAGAAVAGQLLRRRGRARAGVSIT